MDWPSGRKDPSRPNRTGHFRLATGLSMAGALQHTGARREERRAIPKLKVNRTRSTLKTESSLRSAGTRGIDLSLALF
jgi:hypothetical protein